MTLSEATIEEQQQRIGELLSELRSIKLKAEHAKIEAEKARRAADLAATYADDCHRLAERAAKPR